MLLFACHVDHTAPSLPVHAATSHVGPATLTLHLVDPHYVDPCQGRQRREDNNDAKTTTTRGQQRREDNNDVKMTTTRGRRKDDDDAKTTMTRRRRRGHVDHDHDHAMDYIFFSPQLHSHLILTSLGFH